jgi:anaerobic selenocysteine-containing dehydrogenase
VIEMATYGSTDIASTYFQVKAGGDAAALKGIAKHLLEMEAERGDVLDRAFIAEHTQGFEDFAADIAQTRWDDIERESVSARRRSKRWPRPMRNRMPPSLPTGWALPSTIKGRPTSA